MKLFVAKLQFTNGDRPLTVTLFAEDCKEAVERFVSAESREFAGIEVTEVGTDESISLYGRDAAQPNDLIITHTDENWTHRKSNSDRTTRFQTDVKGDLSPSDE